MKRSVFSLAILGNTVAVLVLLLLAICLLRWQNMPVLWTSPGHERLLLAVAVVISYAAFCGVLFYRRQRQHKKAEREAQAFLSASGTGKPWLVASASQTGFAEQLAWQTAAALQAAGVPVRLLTLAKVDADVLANTEKALFVISTTGEGDAPDAALGFTRRVLSGRVDLAGLEYGVLALGDRSYAHFCAFGRALDSWLQHQHAKALFDRVDVDNGDEGALRHWQHHLSLLTGSNIMPDWRAPAYAYWRLVERRCLNPVSLGAPVFHVGFVPVDVLPVWQAGDIAEIGPCNAPSAVDALLEKLGLDGDSRVIIDAIEQAFSAALARYSLPWDEAMVAALRSLSEQGVIDTLKPLPHREYSIASIPADGRVEVLLRQMRQPDGRLGVGSGWLTEYAPLHGEIALRIRENRTFHAPADDRPLILIGNGTGIAGLRALLKGRAAVGRHRNWLLFGERSAAHDFFYREEIEVWQKSGVLQRLDLAFSRDQGERVYVQDVLRAASCELREWVAAGAAIYVCGSLAGMAPAVAAVLTDVLGEAQLEAMAEDGRYRRDVY